MARLRGGPYKVKLHVSTKNSGKVIGGGKPFTAAGMGPDIFGQLIAKIGLGFAVAEIGIDGFRPLVREFILGEKREFGHWIGGPMNFSPEPPSQSLHQLHLAYFDRDDEQYVAVYVRLFANLGGPRNYVIVGQSH